jgi:endonuclease/exonuclease/phosphatase family metal-dependent hydrolase
LAETAPPYFLPVRVIDQKGGNFNLLGVWSQPPYIRSVYNGLDYFQDFLQETACIILGDFNATYKFEPPKVKETTITFNKLVDKQIFERLKLVSCYHEYSGEAYGRETLYTYFHMDAKPYHIDFCFVPKHWRVERVQVESYRLNKDHYAVIVDIFK